MARTMDGRVELWDFDVAVRYVIRVTGKSGYAVLREIVKRICDGELPHRVDGKTVSPTLWKSGDLSLDIVEGRVKVVTISTKKRPISEYGFALSADDVRRLWSRSRLRQADRPRTRVIELLEGPLKGKIRKGALPLEVEKVVKPVYLARFGSKVSRDTIWRAFKQVRT
jgi:hypothetical protein